MEHDTDKIHVIPNGEAWEVEAQSGEPLATDSDKAHAIETAKEIAHEQGISTVILHDGDGITEEVPVPDEPSQPDTNP
jgi:diacylglycerol kinase family enzyme